MINAALPLYVSGKREDSGEHSIISILPVLQQEPAMRLYTCSATVHITERTLESGCTPTSCFPSIAFNLVVCEGAHVHLIFALLSLHTVEVVEYRTFCLLPNFLH